MMRHIRHLRKIGTAAALVCVLSAAWAAPFGSDAVDELRGCLRVPIRDPQSKDEKQYRTDCLERSIKRLGVGDYRRALLLTEWRDNEKEEAIAAIDRPIREKVIGMFVEKLRDTLKNGTIPAKLAAISEIGECGVAVRGIGTVSMAAQLAPDLVEQMKSREPVVRAAAARALGKINPEPQLATKALGDMIANGTYAERVSASDGLAWLLRTLVTLSRGGKNPTAGIAVTRVEVGRDEVTAMATAVAPQAGAGLSDPDVPVQRNCLEALRLASTLLTEQVLEPQIGLPEAPPGRKLSKEDQGEIEGYRRLVEEERTLVMPLARALNDQAGRIARLLNDPKAVPEIRYLSEKALEDMGYARQRLDRKLQSVPGYMPPSEGAKESRRYQPRRNSGIVLVSATELVAQNDKKDADKKDEDKKEPEKPADANLQRDPLKSGLSAVMRDLAAHFNDPNVRVRLAAADALEPLGPMAAPVVPLVVRGLQDPDRFVRWATARLLLRVGPVDTNLTVPLLAPLLCDADLDVRLTAALTLGSYGDAALPAVPELAQAAVTGDPEQRIRAIEAITGVGPKATGAIPALIRSLTHADGRVRTAAAKALGIFGPAASPAAVRPLERALFDNDPVHGPAIRQAASDSLLAITSSGK